MRVIQPYRYLDKAEIEHQATNLLTSVRGKRKRPLQWGSVADAVADFLELGVVWEKIPPDDTGRIAATILPLQREIVINQSIPALEGGFGQSTLAHEIGHWMLHINRDAVGQFIERLDAEMQTEIEPFLCRSLSSEKGIEWQAQHFASCLLMPRFKLEEVRRGRNLDNWKHLYAMQQELGVTISNLTHRLQDLGWIYLPKGSKQIYLSRSAD